MGKPSIFSREYEKRMKRRKRNTLFVSLIIIAIVSAVVLKFTYYPIDFTNIKQNIQAWIDSDTTEEKPNIVSQDDSKENEIVEDTTTEGDAEESQPVEEYIDVNLSSGKVAKAVYIDDGNGEKTFTELKDYDDGVTFDISPSKKSIIVTDINAQITLYNIDGTSKIVSKDNYVSKSGSVFTKEATLQSQPQYLWNSNPKFVNDQNIIFVSNRPYFGTAAVKQYLWMTNIENDSDKVFWELAAKDIQIGDKTEQGIQITVDGRNFIMKNDGSYVQ